MTDERYIDMDEIKANEVKQIHSSTLCWVKLPRQGSNKTGHWEVIIDEGKDEMA